MKKYGCPHCGSTDVFTKEKGAQTGLYCGDCGKWIKWVGKDEKNLIERWIEENKKDTKGETPNFQGVLEQMCKQVSDYVNNNFNPHTTVIITGNEIKIVEDIKFVPVKRD